MERLSDLILQQDGIDPFNIAMTIDRGVNSPSKRVGALGMVRDDVMSPTGSPNCRRGSNHDLAACRGSCESHDNLVSCDYDRYTRRASRDSFDHPGSQASLVRWFSPTVSENDDAVANDSHQRPSNFSGMYSSSHTTVTDSVLMIAPEMTKLARLVSGEASDIGDGNSLRVRHSGTTDRSSSACLTLRRASRDSVAESVQSVAGTSWKPWKPNDASIEVFEPWLGSQVCSLGSLGPTPHEEEEDEEEEDDDDQGDHMPSMIPLPSVPQKFPPRGDRRCFSEQPQQRPEMSAPTVDDETLIERASALFPRRHSLEGRNSLIALQNNAELKRRIELLNLHQEHVRRKAPAMETFRRGMEQKADSRHNSYASLLVRKDLRKRNVEKGPGDELQCSA